MLANTQLVVLIITPRLLRFDLSQPMPDHCQNPFGMSQQVPLKTQQRGTVCYLRWLTIQGYKGIWPLSLKEEQMGGSLKLATTRPTDQILFNFPQVSFPFSNHDLRL